MNNKKIMEDLYALLPYWHYCIDRPFKQIQKENKISFETYYCLQMLRKNGAMTMSELSRILRISKQQATRMIDSLYQYDFVDRLPDDHDRRIIHIKITKRAEDFIDQEIHSDETFLHLLEQKLTQTDIDEFGAAVETMLRIFQSLT